MRQEKFEKELRTADMEANKVRNMIEHEEEIHSRPKKTWFMSERDKKNLKEESVRQAKGEALKREDVRDTKKRKREEFEEKKKKGDFETRKRQRREELKEGKFLTLGDTCQREVCTRSDSTESRNFSQGF
jgi:ATP-dependent RNA helicase DDX27